MRTRVAVVEPSGTASNVFSRYMKLPLMGPIYLGTVLKQAGFQVRVLNENLLGRPLEPADLDADHLLMGGLSCSVQRGYQLARAYRLRNPRGRVVMGGIHATFMPQEALQVAHNVVLGEAEGVIVDLLRHGSDEKIVHGAPVADLDQLPAPDLGLLAGAERMNIAPIMTSRGCPFDCSFCTVTRMFGRRYRTASVPSVMRDLDRLWQPFVFFYDDNLTADRQRAHALCDAMLRRQRKVSWSAQVRVDVARDEGLVEKMRAAGCCKVYIGFESVDPQTLLAYRKHQTVDDIERAVRTLHRHGIAIHGMFVLGSDDERPTAPRDALAFCVRHQVDTVQFSVLTPFPGTPLFESLRASGRLLHTDWSRYDGLHVVFRPAQYAPLQLQMETLYAFKRFYSYRHAAQDALRAARYAVASVLHAGVHTGRCLAARNAMLKVAGHRIVARFMRGNRSYFGSLSASAPSTRTAALAQALSRHWFAVSKSMAAKVPGMSPRRTPHS